MKIKELFEELEKPFQARVSHGRYTVELSLGRLPSQDEKALIRKNIKTVYPKAAVICDREVITTIIDDVRQEHLHELEQIYNDIISTVEETLNTKRGEEIEHGETWLIFDGVPSFDVSVAENISINCQDNTYGLSGLDKIIGPSVYQLQIHDFDKLKGNILSLCKLKVDDIYLHGSFGGDGTTKIIAEILEEFKPTHNVLAMQEALLDAGLKQYAKL